MAERAQQRLCEDGLGLQGGGGTGNGSVNGWRPEPGGAAARADRNQAVATYGVTMQVGGQ